MKTNQKVIVIIVLCSMLALFLVLATRAAAATARRASALERDAQPISRPKQGLPNPQQRVHRVPDVQMCLTNWGFVGSRMRDLDESLGGCFNPNPGEELPAPSLEYPPGSGIEHLFQGGIWIGAVVNDNPYTSVGCDGWTWVHELWPESEYEGVIYERSTRQTVSCYSPGAISEQDAIAVYTDSSRDIPLSPVQRDPWDNRKHFPLFVRVAQTGYSWELEGLDKFIIVEYIIKNIGVKEVQDMYMGLYVDADVMHIDENSFGPYGAQDDMTGFLRSYQVAPGDVREVNIAWAADNDGHGRAGEVTWTQYSPRSVMGVKVLSTPNPNLQVSYNWWISNMAGYPYDWGPWIASNQNVWESMNPYGSGNVFPAGVLGTPGGDVSKYFIMSNGEFDYDQAYACVWPDNHPGEGWLPSSPQCYDLANGFDVRFLLSFGPFDELNPGDSLILGVAYVIGENFHLDPLNHPNPTDPDAYYANLYFGDLVRNALKAESLYHEVVFNHPPEAFSLIWPPNKDFAPRRVRFAWEAAADPDAGDWVKYDLYVSTSPHFPAGSTWIHWNLSATQYTRLLDYGTYYWKVKAKDRRGAETWSDQTRSVIVTGIPHSSLGDLNRDGVIDIGDVVLSVNYLYRSSGAPEPLEVGDCNCDGMVNIGDVVFLLNYLFKSGPSPSCP